MSLVDEVWDESSGSLVDEAWNEEQDYIDQPHVTDKNPKYTAGGAGRVLGTAAMGLASMPVAGLTGLAVGSLAALEGRDAFSEASQAMEGVSRRGNYIQTPVEQEALDQAMLAMKPFQMAGEGLGGIAELASTGDIDKAAAVVEGRSRGSNVAVPIAKVLGETSAMFGAGGVKGTLERGVRGAKDYIRSMDEGLKLDKGVVPEEFGREVIPERPGTEVKPSIVEDVFDEISTATGKTDLQKVTNAEQGKAEPPIGEASLKDKVGIMNDKALSLADRIDKKEIDISKMSSKELDDLYAAADGLTEKYVMDNITGRTSIASMDKNTPDVLEKYVDARIKVLNDIESKYSQSSTIKPPIEGKGVVPTEPTLETGKGTPSGVALRIEAKAIERGLIDTGFDTLAEYDPTTLKAQAQKASDLLNGDFEKTRRIIRGEEPKPEGTNAGPLVIAMEEHLKSVKDPKLAADLAYELANSPLDTQISKAAQELSMNRGRELDSFTAKTAEIRKAREAQAGKDVAKKPDAVKELAERINKENIPKEELVWDRFLQSIKC